MFSVTLAGGALLSQSGRWNPVVMVTSCGIEKLFQGHAVEKLAKLMSLQ